jgi:formylglycine-generating enzyme required for sulfatase activity
MVWIPAGSFLMGSDAHYPEEAPAHPVSVQGFWMDRTPVTNAQLLKFVKANGYITLAEQPADPGLYPDAPPELLAPASIVFVLPPGPVGKGDAYQWWQYIPGADWRHPEGPDSSIKNRPNHPVVHVAHEDAAAYVKRHRKLSHFRHRKLSHPWRLRGGCSRSRSALAWPAADSVLAHGFRDRSGWLSSVLPVAVPLLAVPLRPPWLAAAA